jgi:hypothetical protein
MENCCVRKQDLTKVIQWGTTVLWKMLVLSHGVPSGREELEAGVTGEWEMEILGDSAVISDSDDNKLVSA